MQCKIDHSAEGLVPEFLCRVCHPELKEAGRHLPKVTPTFFMDPRLEASNALRVKQRKEEAARRIAKMKASFAAKQSQPKKVDRTGLRWDSINAKWISDGSNTQEDEEMSHDGTYSSKGAARKGAKRAGLDSFTIVQVGDRFKYVTSSEVMTAAADTAPAAAAPTPAAETESTEMAKKKVRKGKNGGPTKVESVIALAERKSGVTLADIKEKVGVKSLSAAASLIGDVKRVRKSLKREKNGDGVSTYYL